MNRNREKKVTNVNQLLLVVGAVISVAVIVFVSVMIANTDQLERYVDKAYDDVYTIATNMFDFRSGMQDSHALMADAVGDFLRNASEKEVREKLEEARRRSDQAISGLLGKDAGVDREMEALLALDRQLDGIYDTMLAQYFSGNREEAYRLYTEQADPLYTEIDAMISEIISEETAAINSYVVEAKQLNDRINRMAIVWGLFVIALALSASIWSAANISRRNSEAYHREILLNMITGNVDEIFSIYDVIQEKVEFVSLNIERILGIPEKEYLSNKNAWMLTDIVEEKDSRRLQALYSNDHIDEVMEIEFSVVNKRTGQKRLLRAKRYPVFQKDGQVAKFLSMFHDITEDKEARETLKNALAEAESASMAKQGFLSRMSHEIRTPINAIIGMRAIAEMSLGDDEKVRECLHKINVASKHLLGLVNDILDMSRLENGKVNIVKEWFDLDEWLESLTTLIYTRANEKGIRFVVEKENIEQKLLFGDELRIRQIVVNLLTNAVKFTPEGGTVRLLVGQRDKDAGGIHTTFSVIDSGAGIREEFMDKLFEPFEQDRVAHAGHTGGSGLGMAISKNLVTLMGGEIFVKSMPGEGSEFCVDLHLQIPEDDSVALGMEEEKAEAGVDLHGIRVLVVEDNEINMEIMEELLRAVGCEVEQAYDGRQAVEMFEAAEDGWYDIIMMDIQMPVMDGDAAAARIRASKREDAASVIIVAMTAYADHDGVIEDRPGAMNARIAKPIAPETMYRTIRKLLEMQKEQRGE